MVAAAALLVLAGAVMFVLGVRTAVAAWSWSCLAACVLAGVLVVLARRRTPPDPAAPGDATAGDATAGDATAGDATAGDATAGDATAGDADRPAPPSGVPAAPAAAGVPEPAEAPAAAGAPAPAGPPAPRPGPAAAAAAGPPEEDVEVTDLLRVVDLADEVLVVDGQPRYHLAGCTWPGARATVPLPVRRARTDGFTPCALCSPDASLAEVERARRAARRS